jgi:2-polyprenyl-6-methoxyphenol hydroxylase-like FAD-dependent oxidoreductase
LLNTFRLARERPHALDGLQARLAAKVALHNFCLWLNVQLGREPLALRICLTGNLVISFHTKRLIGADGVHSTIRSTWYPALKPQYAGYTCWRGIAHIDRKELQTWAWGYGYQFGITPMTQGRAYWFAQKYAPEGEQEQADERKREMQELFRDWHDPIPAVIEATAECDILRNDVYELPLLRHWSNGRVALLGDAAHAMTPNLGQGGCLAIEDAVILADCLSAEADTVQALKLYEHRRKTRAHRVALFAQRIGQAVQIESPFISGVRNALIKHIPVGIVLQSLMWILDYEP